MARFDCATWRPISNNLGGNLASQRGLVLHHQAGNGSLYQFFNNPASQVSAHFWVSKTGVIEQYADTTRVTWHGRDLNGNWVGVETEGCGTAPHAEAMTEPMVAALARLYAEGARRHAWPNQLASTNGGRGFGYHRMAVNTGCPCDVRLNMRRRDSAPRIRRRLGAGPPDDPPDRSRRHDGSSQAVGQGPAGVYGVHRIRRPGLLRRTGHKRRVGDGRQKLERQERLLDRHRPGRANRDHLHEQGREGVHVHPRVGRRRVGVGRPGRQREMTISLERAPAVVLGAPPEAPLYIYRGDSRSWRFVLWADPGRTEPFDLAGLYVAAQIRRDPDALTAVDLTVNVDLPNVVIVHLSAERSARCPTGRWDMQLTYPDGRVTTAVRGRVAVTPDVTRDE